MDHIDMTRRPYRRRVVVIGRGSRMLLVAVTAGVALITGVMAGCGGAPGTPRVTAPRPSAGATRAPAPSVRTSVTLVPLWSGFTRPVLLTNAGDARDFVVEQGGTIRVIQGGRVLAKPFLDISSLVSTGGERGLFSIAFPPNHRSTGLCYVDYTDVDGNSVVASYRVSPHDVSVADPTTRQVVLTLKQPFPNHNGGQLAFGPDGRLYIGFGDGGGAGDPSRNGQNPGSLLAKILRVGVSGAAGYTIPPDNPFVTAAGYRPEIWDLGLRNPWRFSFDKQTGDLYIADVGQDAWEEIDVEPASSGGRDYGWNRYEGTHPFPPGSAPTPTAGLTMPVVEYGHDLGSSVTGGFVYRGTRSPALDGVYFYADYGSGRIWALTRTATGWRTDQVADVDFDIAGFGTDAQGEVYVLDFTKGAVLRVDAH